MLSFVEEYMSNVDLSEEAPFDEQKITIKAISKVLPVIMERELTTKQQQCLKMFYLQQKTQLEIARELRLSQPTVSRHISTAKSISNKILNYCFYAVKQANEQWMKIE